MTLDTAALTLRPLTSADLLAAQALTAGFDWPHRLEDWALMHRLGRGIVAEQDGAVAGTALCWLYGMDRASLGMIAVPRALQGQGLGRRLMQELIDELGDRVIQLHATEAGLPLYQSLGFSQVGTVRQHQGTAAQTMPVPGQRLRPVADRDLLALAALDRAACGMDRNGLLAALIETASGVILERGGDDVGFALLRPFGRGHVIGPVVAPDVSGAKALLLQLLGTMAGQFVRVDVPEKTGLSPWLEGLGLADVGTVIRMVRGDNAGGAGRVRSFALASQAFG